MKEIITKFSTGPNMVTRYALTQSGVSVTTFTSQKGGQNENKTGELTTEQIQDVYQTDYSYEVADIISEQDNWLDVEITVHKQIALYKPTLEIINPFSENTKILVMADKYTVKTFNVGGLTGIIELDFLKDDELISDSENPEDNSKYFKNSGFGAIEINGKASPIILNPYRSDNPITVVIKLLGNTDPAASGIFRMTVRADI